MEIRGKAWRPGDLKQFYKAEYVCPEAYNDQAAIIEAATDRVRAELIAHSGTKNDPEIYYNIDSREYKSLINDVREKTLKEGREEAWDLARRIVALGKDCYTTAELNSVFGSCSNNSIFEMPVDEAFEKDRTYQKKKEELHVGDEVTFRDTGMACGYVVETGMSEFVTVLTKDRTTHILRISNLAKTGNFNEDLVKGLAAFDK